MSDFPSKLNVLASATTKPIIHPFRSKSRLMKLTVKENVLKTDTNSEITLITPAVGYYRILKHPFE